MSGYEAALLIMRSQHPDAEAAKRLLDGAITEGDPRASYALATWYLHGTHVRKSLRKGVELLQVAASGSVRDAVFDLAVCDERGRGVARDKSRAFELYVRAAEQGDVAARAEVGRMLYYGIGVPKDRAAADRWLENAEGPLPETVTGQRMAS